MANPSPYYTPSGYTYGSQGTYAPGATSPSPFTSFAQQQPTPQQPQRQTNPWNSATYFDDPLSQPIMASWSQRMNQLSAPAPNYGDINAIFGKYLQPDPKTNLAIGSLASLAQGKGAENQYTPQYAASVEQRKKELNADPFSTSDEAAIKARFFDALAMDRDTAYDQNAAQMAARGIGPTSGVAQALGAETSAGYQKARALQTQQMLQYVTDERNRRRDLAVQMAGGLAERGGADAALAQQWQATRAGILGNVVSALMQQQGQGLNAATTMASLRRQQYLDDMSRGESLLETSALPSAISRQRMQDLNSILSGGPTASSIYSQYAQQQQLANQQDQINAQRNAAIWGAAGNIGGQVINNLPWDKWFS